MLTNERLSELRLKAEAATPGPWAWIDDEPWLCAPDPGGDQDGGTIVIEVSWDFTDGPNTEYLAAVDPTTVLALLDEVAALRRENVELKQEVTRQIDWGAA